MALMKQLLRLGSGVRFRLNLSTVNKKYMKIKTPKSHQTDKNNNKKNHHLNKHCSLIGKMKNKKEIAKFLTWKNFIGTYWRLVLFCQLIIFLLINRKDCQKLLKIKYNKWIIKIKHLTVVSWDIDWFI